jgi:FKBP-type peptidyl-prolyl cis-trans isomerase FklB
MPKPFTTTIHLLAAGMLLLGNAHAQQTPPAKSQPAPAANSQSAPDTKTTPGAAANQQPVPGLTTLKDRFSYALGLSLGTSLHQQSVDVDPDLLRQGLKDALAGGATRLTSQEAQAAINEVQTELRKKQQEKMEANKAEGEAFLATNKTKEGVVALPSGLQYKILKEGTGPKPAASDTVVCNYRGTLIDGTEFDSSYKRGQPATFPVGGVIKGWTEALQLMPVGSKWQLFIPSDLAYGPRGTGTSIAPNSTLIFEVELLSIQAKEAPKAPEKAPEKAPDKAPTKPPDKQ